MKNKTETYSLTTLADNSYCAILKNGMEINPIAVWYNEDLCLYIEMQNCKFAEVRVRATLTKKMQVLSDLQFYFNGEKYDLLRPEFSKLINFMADLSQRARRGALSCEADFISKINKNIAEYFSSEAMKAEVKKLFKL